MKKKREEEGVGLLLLSKSEKYDTALDFYLDPRQQFSFLYILPNIRLQFSSVTKRQRKVKTIAVHKYN